MRHQESHVSDQELALLADGELDPGRAREVAAHLAACWFCRARRQDIENAIVDFVRLHRGTLDGRLPPPAPVRGMLKARLAHVAGTNRGGWRWPRLQTLSYAGAALMAILLAGALWSDWRENPARVSVERPVPVSFPEPSLTPGAVATMNKDQICGTPRPKNRAVPASLRRQVFEEYGIPSAEPRAYEVDYLITPALGGADDIRNLWPQSSIAAVWNARVKDALEDRLHDLVCEGDLDLKTAQRDIASDWIAAYKKYFRTDQPAAVAR
jgi:hypothetical protein